MQTAVEILEREFLDARAKILIIAATLDRVDRAEGRVTDDRRVEKLREAIRILIDDDSNRAEKVQLLFSRPYDADWRKKFQID